MRQILLAKLFSLGLAACAAAERPYLSNMIGFTCGGPQMDKVSKQVGRSLCVQMDMLPNLSEMTDRAIEAAAHSPVPPEQFAMMDQSNTDPNAKICKEVYDRPLDATKLTYLLYAYNSFWIAKAYVAHNAYSFHQAPAFDSLGLTPPILAVHG